MITNFRTYDSAIYFAQKCRKLNLDPDLLDQLNRASASIALNLAEGSGADTLKERHRFYIISLKSFRESEAILRIAEVKNNEFLQKANELGAKLYKLCKSTSKPPHP